jgi:hypothetical protein
MNGRTVEGHTVLMNAAILQEYDMMYILLEAGADPRARDNAGHTAGTYLFDHAIIRARTAETPKWPQRCTDLMTKKGFDFEKEWTRYAEIKRRANATRGPKNVTASQNPAK